MKTTDAIGSNQTTHTPTCDEKSDYQTPYIWANKVIRSIGEQLPQDEAAKASLKQKVIKAVSISGMMLKDCGPFRDDFDVCIQAVTQIADAIKFIGKDLRQNTAQMKLIVKQTVSTNGMFLASYYCQPFSNDLEIALTALKSTLAAIVEVGDDLKKNPEFLEKAKELVLQYYTQLLPENYDVLFMNLPENLRSDKDICSAHNAHVQQYEIRWKEEHKDMLDL